MKNSGAFRHRMTLEKATFADNASGGTNKSWSKVRDIFCSLKTLEGMEIVEADGVTYRRRIEIETRFAADIGNTNRLKHGSAIYNIDHLDDLNGQGRFLKLLCTVAA